jgi:hypothetical protein
MPEKLVRQRHEVPVLYGPLHIVMKHVIEGLWLCCASVLDFIDHTFNPIQLYIDSMFVLSLKLPNCLTEFIFNVPVKLVLC